MKAELSAEEQRLLDDALKAASHTRLLTIDGGARHQAASVFAAAFGESEALVVADDRTWAAAGTDVQASFRQAGIQCRQFLFPSDVYAEHLYVELLQNGVGADSAILVAVGSGTINDITKLVSHRLGRSYMVVATAASMDGYTAYGSSITFRGSKQTFDCPAPRAVVADLNVIAGAPPALNASGYADLFAKGVAGADWILADAAGEEPIAPTVWAMVQEFLPQWISAAEQVPRGDPDCLRRLVAGLMISGFAMQAARSSRPASGAEHQFSHLWDMQHHTFEGAAPSHGFKVGIGTLASLDLYEVLLRRDLNRLDIDAAIAAWPSLPQVETRIRDLLGSDELGQKAIEETRAKYISADRLRAQLVRLRDGWPDLAERLKRHLRPFADARAMLRQAGCPFVCTQIGISQDRLRLSYEQAYYIRRRYTVLDFAKRCGVFDAALDEIFARSP